MGVGGKEQCHVAEVQRQGQACAGWAGAAMPGTTWENHRQNNSGKRMATRRRQLRKLGDRLAGKDSWDSGAFSQVLSLHTHAHRIYAWCEKKGNHDGKTGEETQLEQRGHRKKG